MVDFNLKIDANNTVRKVSDTLFGLFLEDINYACDGGLNANMVNNHSFDAVYMENEGVSSVRMAIGLVRKVNAKVDRLRYWKCIGGSLESLHENPVSNDSWSARIRSQGKCRLENKGYNGSRIHANSNAMSIVDRKEYEFTCWIRKKDFNGNVKVFLEDERGQVITQIKTIKITEQWVFVKEILKGTKTEYGKLVIALDGEGVLDIDCISLMDCDIWGKENPKWSQGKLRKDLVEVLRDLNPKFLRFPGGCIVEGAELGNEYQWKHSVGPILDRKPNYNLWAADTPDGGYSQSLQVGFYEYFLLCEDLNIEPLPVVWAGLNCQIRKRGKLELDAPDFYERVIQNALDLIDYATGDPTTNKWAKLRAEAGHPEPFQLNYIGLGNENLGEDYIHRFGMIKKEIDAKYPGITCIMSSGALPDGKAFELSWNKAKEKFPDIYIDEHFYKKPEWVESRYQRYDNYERGTAKVFLGEYAAKDLLKDGILSKKFIPNRYKTALAEAAFITGLERNSDVVAMSCYAPLFCLVEGNQWRHNLIDFNPAHTLKTANYFVQQMFATTVGNKVIGIDSDLPKGIYCSATKKANKVIIKLVNTNRNSVIAKIDLINVKATIAQITYLNANSLRSMNQLSFKGEPVYEIEPHCKDVNIKLDTFALSIEKWAFYVIEIEQ
ncbi:alpha-L-arabinofuranosidase C-terminal domain-containing protein [Vallitalea guaymasensis]|uniref:non-reducing end alpha-L-arabinofuranosidase n=1 Tax=Vallitalea guaymasensis TaxID=1185412 RepID=A0A8J8SAE0_9FIRM|nr:alpha-L-arabinofuranosidase C-terminal domain-containing protein [Vallitalea guaymasensis]QUH27562.1 hypothetical protein HYG85_00955 [Vallitalea guaymasensis]